MFAVSLRDPDGRPPGPRCRCCKRGRRHPAGWQRNASEADTIDAPRIPHV